MRLFVDNFTLIAENTTKYYLELKKNYQQRFNDENSLLAIAGVLDAQNYIFIEHSLDITAIVNIANKSLSRRKEDITDYKRVKLQKLELITDYKEKILSFTKSEEWEQDTLFNFIFSLEILLFSIDIPELLHSDIEVACFQSADLMVNAIQKTQEEYKGEALFESATNSMMNSPEFIEIRKQLGLTY